VAWFTSHAQGRGARRFAPWFMPKPVARQRRVAYEGWQDSLWGEGMTDFELQRKNMVESQVRPSNVTDRRITAAMGAVPREAFVPAHLVDLAYMDTALAWSPARALMAPRDFARLIQLADIAPGDVVLDVGAGRGYSSAVLACIAEQVVALESDPDAHAAAKSALDPTATDPSNATVTCVMGPLTAGWPDGGPYDVIMIEGAVPADPELLLGQLKDGGRLVAVVVEKGVGRAVIFRKMQDVVSRRTAFESAAPLLPGFEPARPAFSF
jgi:protein-L-isoaspartate(D-aspartate) O-methyltransferase